MPLIPEVLGVQDSNFHNLSASLSGHVIGDAGRAVREVRKVAPSCHSNCERRQFADARPVVGGCAASGTIGTVRWSCTVPSMLTVRLLPLSLRAKEAAYQQGQ